MNSLLLGVCENVRFEVCWLGKFLVTSVERADIRSVARVDSNMRPQVEVEGEPFATPYKGQWWYACILEWFIHFLFIAFLPSNVHWKGFSPVCTSWCLFNLELSTKALPHSAQTWTRGPWVWRCFRIAELSRNILEQPLWGQAIVRGTSSPDWRFGFILKIEINHLKPRLISQVYFY